MLRNKSKYKRGKHCQAGQRLEAGLTEVKRKLRVVVSLPVGDEVDLILPPLLLEALLGAPVVAHAAARQDDDQGPNQPEPCRGRQPHNYIYHSNNHLLWLNVVKLRSGGRMWPIT